jgi:hypothetical protein
MNLFLSLTESYLAAFAAAKVESTELTDILEMLKQIDSNIKSYGSRILWVLVVIAMGIMGIKFLLD